ncbi:MAG: phosphoribosyl-ATP diphosphatase [Halioglobus sp.]
MSDVLSQLTEILENRKSAEASESYVASLHEQGLNKILEKVGEESTEVILAAKDANVTGDKSALLAETADLWFHCMVMLSHLDVNADQVLEILRDRFDISGLEEKASRNNTNSST